MTELPLNQVLCGDCREVMKDFPDNSIDLVVTDPPYGLSFMGKDWDKTLPPKQAFNEMFRVLKPGALTFVMSSPRQDVLWRMLSMLEGVGFELTQSYIEWIYKTGFPKAYDLSKGIDRKNARLKKEYDDLANYLKRKRMKLDLNQRDVSKHFPSKTGGITGCVANWELGYNIPTKEQWIVLKNVLQIDTNEFDEIINRIEANREIVGKDAHWSKNGVLPWHGQEWNITKAKKVLAKKWDGWKSQTGLKPAHEPILMVNKPFSESTIVDNVLRWGTGAINVDACRIPFQNEVDPRLENEIPRKGGFSSNSEIYHNDPKYAIDSYPSKGRFPANLLVSDKAIDTGELTRSGAKLPHHVMRKPQRVAYGEFGEMSGYNYYEDTGDQSRYFDLDAWAKHHGFLDVPKPDNAERDFGLKGSKRVPKSKFNLSDGSKDMRFDGIIPTPRRNVHPTVKPIKLMAYLIELGCPRDGIVLDPFCGSGTTCIAAKQLVRKYVGIEIKSEYVALAEARIEAYPVPLDWFEDESVVIPPIRRQEK